MVSAQTKNRKLERDAERAAQEVRIAWHKLSIEDSIRFAEIDDVLGDANVLAQALAQGIATTEMVERLLEMRKPEYSKALIVKRREFLAEYVEYVPHDWFTDKAPAELDFSNADTYKFLQTARFNELCSMMRFGQPQQEAASKN